MVCPGALSHLPRVTITLKNDDEVFEGLKAMCAQALPGDLDEDEDILSIQRVRDPCNSAPLQLDEINHSNMASIANMMSS